MEVSFRLCTFTQMKLSEQCLLHSLINANNILSSLKVFLPGLMKYDRRQNSVFRLGSNDFQAQELKSQLTSPWPNKWESR